MKPKTPQQMLRRVVTGSVRRRERQLTTPEMHQLRIARKTLNYSDAGAWIMGGPTKKEAVEIIYRLTGQIVALEPPMEEIA